MRIRVSYSFGYFPLARQLPRDTRLWGEHEFVFDDSPGADAGQFDAWVVYNDLLADVPRTVNCPRSRTLLFVGEPPSRTQLHPEYAHQFARIVTCLPPRGAANFVAAQQALPWWIGLRRQARTSFETRLDYDALRQLDEVPKIADLSIVCSTLAITPTHRQRLRFVRRLMEHFRSRLTAYGEGFNRIEDKWDAIAPFRYHIVLENFRAPHYWSEKLADAFLGGALPIYCGAPNIEAYFPAQSLVSIDIADPASAIATIEAALASDLYTQRLPFLQTARHAVLERYNFFPAALEHLSAMPADGRAPVTLRPSRAFRPTMRMNLARATYLTRELVARWHFALQGPR